MRSRLMQRGRPARLRPRPRAATIPHPPPAARYKAFRQLNATPLQLDPHSRKRPKPGPWLDELFGGGGALDRLAHALIMARALPLKEVLEGFEFVTRARSRVRAPVVADLCCGHGLAGMLYGVLHRDVERVVLVDRVCPPSFAATLEALGSVARWLPDKVTYIESDLSRADLPPGAAVLGVHACGRRTDRVIDRALELRGPVAVLPCCHAKAGVPGPATLSDHLGPGCATDVARTWRLHAAGYTTRWDTIPEAITPKNRLVLGWPGAAGG